MSTWWVAQTYQISPVLLGSWVIWVISSIVLHELGHGLAAIRVGDRTPIETGHMTLNPIVHMGYMSLLMFALFGFTWGAMPINPGRFRGRYAESFVAAAGPMVNLILAAVCILGDALWLSYGRNAVGSSGVGMPSHVATNIHTFLWTGAMINVMGFLFNLVPIPPLDGSKIVANFVPAYDRLMNSERGGLIGLVCFALLFSVGGSKIWDVTATIANVSIRALTNIFGGTLQSPMG